MIGAVASISGVISSAIIAFSFGGFVYFFININITEGYNPSANSLWSFSPNRFKVLGMKVTLPTLKLALSSNIKRIRKEQGISQEKLALKADIDRSYMSEVERCLANPSIEALLKIGNALDASPSELLQVSKKKI